MNKLEVGQELIVENLGKHAHRRYVRVTIIKVGRRYFEVSYPAGTKFHIDNLRQVSQYTPDYQIHLCEQKLYNQIVARVCHTRLVQLFNGFNSNPGNYTSDQLLSACSALGLTEEVNEALKPKIEQLMEDLSEEDANENN